jgi:hypothetical protein
MRELQEKYPNLLFLLCEQVFMDNLNDKIQFLPPEIRNALGGAVANFQNLDITKPDQIGNAINHAIGQVAGNAVNDISNKFKKFF